MRDDAAFIGSVPQNYDRYCGPTQFEPYADDLAERIAAARPQKALLETACGTGILTERVRARLASSVRLVATDLSAAMLDHARRARGSIAGIEWQEADAAALPFSPESFDAVACQFGIMFVPDKSSALREARRVLVPGSLFAFNVWDTIEANPSIAIIQKTICSFLGQEPRSSGRPSASSTATSSGVCSKRALSSASRSSPSASLPSAPAPDGAPPVP